MEHFEYENCEPQKGNTNEIRDILTQTIEKSSDHGKIEKIAGLVAVYQTYRTCETTQGIFPEWVQKAIGIFGYTLNTEEEQREAIEIIRTSIAGLMERFGYVFLGMSNWNYLVAQYRLSAEGGYEGSEIILPEEPFGFIGQKVLEENPEYNEFEIEEKVNDVIGHMRDAIEQAITVFLMAVVRRKMSTSLYRYLKRIIQDMYKGDSSQALRDLQEKREESKFITSYSGNMIRLVGDLGVYHAADISPEDQRDGAREAMLSVIHSAASLIFSKNKLEERSLKKIFEKADEKAVKIIIETLLKELELCIMDGLFETIET